MNKLVKPLCKCNNYCTNAQNVVCFATASPFLVAPAKRAGVCEHYTFFLGFHSDKSFIAAVNTTAITISRKLVISMINTTLSATQQKKTCAKTFCRS